MGDRILKWIEAIVGGVVTFMLLMFFYYSFISGYLENKSRSGDFGDTLGSLGLGFSFITLAISVGFCMIFVYHHLLTKNKTIISIECNSNLSLSKPASGDKKILIALGLFITIAYYFLLYFFRDIFSLVFVSPYIFLIPFILTRKGVWLKKIIIIGILFSAGFLFEYLLRL